jgi:hypothetical protein
VRAYTNPHRETNCSGAPAAGGCQSAASLDNLVDNTTVFMNARKDLERMTARRASMRQVPAGSPRERLLPFQHNVRLRLTRDESPDAIAADLARIHSVPEPDALAFVQEIAAKHLVAGNQ